jgi:hypothetical protein
MQTIHDFLRQHPVRITTERANNNPNMVSDRPMRHWRVTLHGPLGKATLYFSQGMGHTSPPTVADVLSCMASDVSSIESARDMDDWARDMGMELYIEDPRTGRERKNPEIAKTWRAIQREKEQLQAMFGGAAHDLIYETEPL